MAGYNYFTPQGYGNPYMQNYFPQTYQPQIPQQQSQQQGTMPNAQNSIIWVSGIDEAQRYPVAPNGAVALWEQSGKTIYVKQADATGRPNLTVYDLVERTETPREAVSHNTKAETPEYVTKREFDALCATVEEIKANSVKRTSLRKREIEDE